MTVDLQVAQCTLEGIIVALERKKAAWTMTTNMAEFRLQVAIQYGDKCRWRSNYWIVTQP